MPSPLFVCDERLSAKGNLSYPKNMETEEALTCNLQYPVYRLTCISVDVFFGRHDWSSSIVIGSSKESPR